MGFFSKLFSKKKSSIPTIKVPGATHAVACVLVKTNKDNTVNSVRCRNGQWTLSYRDGNERKFDGPDVSPLLRSDGEFKYIGSGMFVSNVPLLIRLGRSNKADRRDYILTLDASGTIKPAVNSTKVIDNAISQLAVHREASPAEVSQKSHQNQKQKQRQGQPNNSGQGAADRPNEAEIKSDAEKDIIRKLRTRVIEMAELVGKINPEKKYTKAMNNYTLSLDQILDILSAGIEALKSDISSKATPDHVHDAEDMQEEDTAEGFDVDRVTPAKETDALGVDIPPSLLIEEEEKPVAKRMPKEVDEIFDSLDGIMNKLDNFMFYCDDDRPYDEGLRSTLNSLLENLYEIDDEDAETVHSKIKELLKNELCMEDNFFGKIGTYKAYCAMEGLSNTTRRGGIYFDIDKVERIYDEVSSLLSGYELCQSLPRLCVDDYDEEQYDCDESRTVSTLAALYGSDFEKVKSELPNGCIIDIAHLGYIDENGDGRKTKVIIKR